MRVTASRSRPMRRGLLRQLKPRDRGPRSGRVQRQEVDRTGIVTAGGGYGTNHSAGEATHYRHPGQGIVPCAGPCEEEIGAAGFGTEVVPGVTWKQCLGGQELVPACRAIGIDIGPGFQPSNRATVDLDFADAGCKAKASRLL